MSNPWQGAAIPLDGGIAADEWGPAGVLPDPNDEERPTVYASVYEWVEKWLKRSYRRRVKTQHRAWCPEWWMHPEAVVRLSALWHAWEKLYDGQVGTGESEWWIGHGDPMMDRLLDPTGPLQGCSEDGHVEEAAIPPLPTVPFPGLETSDADPVSG